MPRLGHAYIQCVKTVSDRTDMLHGDCKETALSRVGLLSVVIMARKEIIWNDVS